MACADHMEQLSLLDRELTDSVKVREERLPFKQSVVAAKVDGVHTDIVLSEYSNRVLIVITQCQKVASFISVNKDVAQEGCGVQQEVYLVRTIFGTQQEDSQELVARFLAEHTKLEKPAIFGLGLRDHSPRTVRALATMESNSTSTFGQMVIGPPGSGKTTYCKMMSEFLESIGRKVAVINIDPANDVLPYVPAVDISELITVEDAMKHLNLGPNGALMYCMEFLVQNLNWLWEKLNPLRNHYLLIDCPGQVELYTHHNAVNNVIEELSNNGFRLCAVQLIDSHYCSDPGKFISTLLLAMTSMLHLGLPQINILSKMDVLLQQRDRLQFGIDFYTDVLDLNYLLDALDGGPFTKKYCKLNAALVSLVEDYSLVSFLPLDVKDKKSLLQVRNAADRAGGWVYGQGEEHSVQQMLACAVGAQTESDRIGDLRDAMAEDFNEDNDA